MPEAIDRASEAEPEIAELTLGDAFLYIYTSGTTGYPKPALVRHAKFTMGASGQSVTLLGDSGLLVVIRGADEHTSYSGPTDFKTGYGKLREARQVEDFEGTVQWALGLSGTACYRVYVLKNPDRLVIDAQAP